MGNLYAANRKWQWYIICRYNTLNITKINNSFYQWKINVMFSHTCEIFEQNSLTQPMQPKLCNFLHVLIWVMSWSVTNGYEISDVISLAMVLTQQIKKQFGASIVEHFILCRLYYVDCFVLQLHGTLWVLRLSISTHLRVQVNYCHIQWFYSSVRWVD